MLSIGGADQGGVVCPTNAVTGNLPDRRDLRVTVHVWLCGYNMTPYRCRNNADSECSADGDDLLMTAMVMVIRIMLAMAEGPSDYGYDTSHDGKDNMPLLRVTIPLAKKNPMTGEEIHQAK